MHKTLSYGIYGILYYITNKWIQRANFKGIFCKICLCANDTTRHTYTHAHTHAHTRKNFFENAVNSVYVVIQPRRIRNWFGNTTTESFAVCGTSPTKSVMREENASFLSFWRARSWERKLPKMPVNCSAVASVVVINHSVLLTSGR